jgi:nucleoside-diphosphate-sugar epimerase
MRIILTGATGFIGSNVLRQFLNAGHEIAILVRPDSCTSRIADELSKVICISGDLCDLSAVRPALKEFGPDTAVHCAWDGVAGGERNYYRQIENLKYTTDFIEESAAAGAKHWIGLGSQGEYGPHDGPIDENTDARPATLYGAVKYATSITSSVLCGLRSMRFAWLRIFSTYGPKDNPEWMIPSLALCLARGERPALTKGTQLWDFLHVEDAANAICHVVERQDLSGTFNLGSGSSRTIRSIAEEIRDLINPALELGFGEVPFRPDQVTHLEADIGRLRNSGWEFQVKWADGLRETVDWYCANQNELTNQRIKGATNRA